MGFQTRKSQKLETAPPDYPVSHEEDRSNRTVLFIVDVESSKHWIKQTVKKLYDTDVAKVNTQIRPGERKTYVSQASDYDALDAANSFGII
ncbi:60S Ribosomal Protein L23A [Manis pentadactyla]|nr:60S Ribosomal Protein L23A [Manis pentadactyla]